VMVRLSKVLNLSDVDWSNVRNLLCLTGRCRWAADLIHCIASEIQEKRMKKEDVEHIDKETFLVDCINRVVDDITTQMANAIASRLTEAQLSSSTTQWERRLLQTVYVVCFLFPNHTSAVRLMMRQAEIDLLLTLSVGQLVGHDAVRRKLVVFDKMTEGAFKIIAEHLNWSVTDIVAANVIDAKGSHNTQERGLDYQLVVAAALLEYEGTVADFVCKVAKRAAEADAADPPAAAGLPRWCLRATLRTAGFTSFNDAGDVRYYYKDPSKRIGVICQPDNNHRADGFGILSNLQRDNWSQAPQSRDSLTTPEEEGRELAARAIDDRTYGDGNEPAPMERASSSSEQLSERVCTAIEEYKANELATIDEAFCGGQLAEPIMEPVAADDDGVAYELVYSVKVHAEPISGFDRADDLVSTILDGAYEQKPSTQWKAAKRAVDHKRQAPIKRVRGEDQTVDLQDSKEDRATSRSNWEQITYPRIKQITDGRRLRLHVNLGSYASYDENKYTRREYDTGINETTKELEKVFVQGNEVRVIIDKTNCDILFTGNSREIVSKILADNENTRRFNAQKKATAKRRWL